MVWVRQGSVGHHRTKHHGFMLGVVSVDGEHSANAKQVDRDMFTYLIKSGRCRSSFVPIRSYQYHPMGNDRCEAPPLTHASSAAPSIDTRVPHALSYGG